MPAGRRTTAQRLEHRERRLLAGAEAGLGFGRPGPRVLLQEPVGVLAPSRALADQADFGLALAHHHALDERRERQDGCPVTSLSAGPS